MALLHRPQALNEGYGKTVREWSPEPPVIPPGRPLPKNYAPSFGASFAGFNSPLPIRYRSRGLAQRPNFQEVLGTGNKGMEIRISRKLWEWATVKSEVWHDAMCPKTSPAEQFTEWGRGQVGRGPGGSLSSLHKLCKLRETACQTGSVLKKPPPPPDITPDNAWDQTLSWCY